jgi:cytochrome P450
MTESVPSNPIPEITSIEDTSPQAIIVHKPEVFNPFSTGPRDCIGKSLAMLEMRLLIAKLVWNFDLVAVDKPYEWGSQKTYFLWEKKGLKVGLKVRV